MNFFNKWLKKEIWILDLLLNKVALTKWFSAKYMKTLVKEGGGGGGGGIIGGWPWSVCFPL